MKSSDADKEQAPAEAVERVADSRATGTAGWPARVLALNHAVGNRALTPLLQRARAESALLMRAPVQVNQLVTEKTDSSRLESVNWYARYQVELSDTRCTATIKVKLKPDSGVTEDEVKRVKKDVGEAFPRYFSGRFMLTDPGILWDDNWILIVGVEFVDSGEHLTVALHKGKGSDNRQNWYVDTPSITKAHELGNQLGLLDEYVEEGVIPRKDASAPGVFTDNSIMGDYYKEGVDKAEVKARHGTRLAQVIGKALGKDLVAKKITHSLEYISK